MTGKQRSFLKSLAHDLNPTIQVGKNGISDNLINEIEIALEHRELVKLSLLVAESDEKEELKEEILDATGADFVSLVGKKLTIYRESSLLNKEERIQLPKQKAKS